MVESPSSPSPMRQPEHATLYLEQYEALASQHPWVATTAETLVQFAAARGLEWAGRRVGLPVSNGNITSQEAFATEHPALGLAGALVYAPVAEEVIARYLPAQVKWYLRDRGHEQAARLVDVVSTLGFIAGHVGPESKLPISTGIGAAHYSYLEEHRGIPHAVYSHALHNALYVATISGPRVLRNRRLRK